MESPFERVAPRLPVSFPFFVSFVYAPGKENMAFSPRQQSVFQRMGDYAKYFGVPESGENVRKAEIHWLFMEKNDTQRTVR